MATRLGLAQKPLRRAVVVSKNQRVLEKFVVHDDGLKFLFGHKEIFLAVLFAATRRARGVRDREIQIMNHLEQFIQTMFIQTMFIRRRLIPGSAPAPAISRSPTSSAGPSR